MGSPAKTFAPPLIHLVDLERTEYVGRIVRTDIVIAGVGETFHVPRAWAVECPEDDCAPRSVELGQTATLPLLSMCRMSHDQLIGFTRRLAGCSHRSHVKIRAWATVTELLALPAANVHVGARDYREKAVALVGSLQHSNIRYRATGIVIAEPKQQRASLLISALERLQSAAEGFRLTPEVQQALDVFRVPGETVDDAERHARRIAATITETVTKVFGATACTCSWLRFSSFTACRTSPGTGSGSKAPSIFR